MNSDTKKKIFIGVSIAAAFILAGFFIKSRLKSAPKENSSSAQTKQASSKTMDTKESGQIKQPAVNRDQMINVLKKAKINNFNLLKKISTLATKICQQMGMSKIEPSIVKNILQSPESPLKVEQEFKKNYVEACKSVNATYADFKQSLDFYLNNQDTEIQTIVGEIEKEYENSLMGRVPHIKVTIPADLTKERLKEIYKKLALKRYLLQIDIFKKVRGKTQEQLRSNKDLINSIPSPEQEEQKILEDQGLGANDQPATAVYTAALTQYKDDTQMKAQLQKIETHYGQIFNRYKVKIQTNKITQNELNQLQDELIYSDSY